jgi:hypothetical protein
VPSTCQLMTTYCGKETVKKTSMVGRYFIFHHVTPIYTSDNTSHTRQLHFQSAHRQSSNVCLYGRCVHVGTVLCTLASLMISPFLRFQHGTRITAETYLPLACPTHNWQASRCTCLRALAMRCLHGRLTITTIHHLTAA